MEVLENAVKKTINYEKKEWAVAWRQSQGTEVEMWNGIIKDFNTLCLFGNWKTKSDSCKASTFFLEKTKPAMPAVNLSHGTKWVFLNLHQAWLGSADVPESQKREEEDGVGGEDIWKWCRHHFIGTYFGFHATAKWQLALSKCQTPKQKTNCNSQANRSFNQISPTCEHRVGKCSPG